MQNHLSDKIPQFKMWDKGNKVMHHNVEFISSGDENSEGGDWVIFKSDKQTLKRGEVLENPFFMEQMVVMFPVLRKDDNQVSAFSDDVIEFEHEGETKRGVISKVRFEDTPMVEITDIPEVEYHPAVFIAELLGIKQHLKVAVSLSQIKSFKIVGNINEMEDGKDESKEVKADEPKAKESNEWCKRMDWCKKHSMSPSDQNNWDLAGLGVKYNMTWKEISVWTTQVEQWVNVLGMNKRDIKKFVNFLNNETCKTNETAISQELIGDTFEFLFGDKDSSSKGGCCEQN